MTLFPPPGREAGLTEGDDPPGTMQWADPSLAFQTVAHLQQPPDLQVTQDLGWVAGRGAGVGHREPLVFILSLCQVFFFSAQSVF